MFKTDTFVIITVIGECKETAVFVEQLVKDQVIINQVTQLDFQVTAAKSHPGSSALWRVHASEQTQNSTQMGKRWSTATVHEQHGHPAAPGGRQWPCTSPQSAQTTITQKTSSVWGVRPPSFLNSNDVFSLNMWGTTPPGRGQLCSCNTHLQHHDVSRCGNTFAFRKRGL